MRNKLRLAIAVSCLLFTAATLGLLLSLLSVKADGPINFVPVKVAAGETCNLAIDAEGYIWAWGGNANGVLGDGTITARSEPVRHNGAHHNRKYVAISAFHHSLAIDTDGYLWAWGSNGNGKLGDGTTTASREPIRQNGVHRDRKYSAVSAGYDYSLALDLDGYLWVWGNNNNGQLGTGTTTASSEPIRQEGAHTNRKYIAISAGYYHCLAIDIDGYLWAWGKNDKGQLGIGITSSSSLEPIRQNGVHTNRKYTAVSASTASFGHSLAIDSDGYLWVWGNIEAGRLGLTGGTNRLEPTRQNGIHTDRKYSAIHASSLHSLAIDKEGYIWVWGASGNRLGVDAGGESTVSEPTRHEGIHYSRKYSAISAGGDYSIAIDKDGYLWTWGTNANGQLGNGTTTDSNQPVQISFIKPITNPNDPNDPGDSNGDDNGDDNGDNVPIDSNFLIYFLFGGGILITVVLVIKSFIQRDGI